MASLHGECERVVERDGDRYKLITNSTNVLTAAKQAYKQDPKTNETVQIHIAETPEQAEALIARPPYRFIAMTSRQKYLLTTTHFHHSAKVGNPGNLQPIISLKKLSESFDGVVLRFDSVRWSRESRITNHDATNPQSVC